LIAVAAFLFSPVEQGYFYTFLSLGAAQYFCDLGVGFVLGNIAGRRTAGDVEGQPFTPEALRSMRQVLRFALRWSLMSGAILIVILGLLGGRIFWGTETNGTPLTHVWLVYATLAAYTMALHMILRIVEAVGFVVEAALTRSVQSFVNILILAAFASMGFGMWAVVIGLAVALATATAFFWSLSAKLRSAFGRPGPGAEGIIWRRDILPFQSRVAASWIGSYGIFQAQVPFLFAFAGPVAAGQFGMAMQIFQALNTTGNIFLTFSVKRWTTLSMQSDWTELLANFR
jgi:O-antigen/teichoic acid export membrane protein